MNRDRTSAQYVISLLIFLCATAAVQAQISESLHILVISSYNSAFPTFFDQIDGVRDSFAPMNAEIDVEFLDSKRFDYPAMEDLLHASLSLKIQKLDFTYDGVITTDDNALRFVIENQQLFPPNIPVVFCGVNNRELALSMNSIPNISGVVEAVSFEDTLQLIMDTFEQTQTIYALYDRTASGMGDYETFMTYGNRFPLSSINMSEMRYSQYLQKISQLRQGEILLLLSAYQDGDGNIYSFPKTLSDIYQNSNVPIFHLWYHGMDSGIFGGKLISQYVQAQQASEVIIQHLSGHQDISQQRVIDESPNIYVFDYNELQRFHIPISHLPEDSSIINRPENIFTVNPGMTRLILLAFTIQFALIILLIVTIIRSKKVAQLLRHSELRFQNLFTYSPIAFIEEDYSQVRSYLSSLQIPEETSLGKYLYSQPEIATECLNRVRIIAANNAALRLYRASTIGELQASFRDIFTDERMTLFIAMLLTLASGGDTYNSTGNAITFEGDIIWTNIHMELAPSAKNTWSHVYIGLEDITETVKSQNELRNSLEEKNLLLRDIHHRVNNNLAIITSFLSLETLSSRSSETIEVLNDSARRIKAMALVHRQMYHSDALHNLNLETFLTELVQEIFSASSRSCENIDVSIKSEDVLFDREDLIPLGLIVNEIISNSLNHAFVETKNPKLIVEVTAPKQEQSIRLDIQDNGRGFPEENGDERSYRHSMGLQIIQALINQLGAEMQRENHNGAHYSITIPLRSRE